MTHVLYFMSVLFMISLISFFILTIPPKLIWLIYDVILHIIQQDPRVEKVRAQRSLYFCRTRTNPVSGEQLPSNDKTKCSRCGSSPLPPALWPSGTSILIPSSAKKIPARSSVTHTHSPSTLSSTHGVQVAIFCHNESFMTVRI